MIWGPATAARVRLAIREVLGRKAELMSSSAYGPRTRATDDGVRRSRPRDGLSGLPKTRAEHRRFALGLFFGRLVLNHIPVLYQNSILDAKNVGGNPASWGARPHSTGNA